MRLLLDSHVALWNLLDDARISERARRAIVEASEVFYSAVTPWELSIKAGVGKLTVPDAMGAALRRNGFTELPITSIHGERAGRLPLHHRDPFDRMLIAQAQSEHLTIVTVDSAFADYEVELLDPST